MSGIRCLVLAATVTAWAALGCEQTQEMPPESAMTEATTAAEAALPVGNPYPGYCIVMGEKVDMAAAESDADLHSDHEGKRYYFCCPGCKPKFEKDPEKFIASPAQPKKAGES